MQYRIVRNPPSSKFHTKFQLNSSIHHTPNIKVKQGLQQYKKKRSGTIRKYFEQRIIPSCYDITAKKEAFMSLRMEKSREEVHDDYKSRIEEMHEKVQHHKNEHDKIHEERKVMQAQHDLEVI
jgi:hypothetical protein